MLSPIRLKKREERRIRAGHPWIFSNEIDTNLTPLKSFKPGDEVLVVASDKSILGVAYINPHSLIAGRIFSRDPKHRLDKSFFQTQIKKALVLRDSLFDQPYYRLVFSEADNLPGIVIDRFGHDFVVQINTAGMELRKEIVVESLCSIFSDINSILFRNDSQIRVHEGLELYVKPAFGSPPEEIKLIENNTQFIAPLEKGQKTGWFYDHRLNRARLQMYVKDKHVLDMFSYLGGWGIQAACFGAKHVTCIEASKLACDYIHKNAALNHVEQKVKVICDDAFDALKDLSQEKQRYSVIVLDPPAFVKKFKDKKEGLLAYQRLNELAIKLLPENGILFSCSCSMHVSMEDLVEIMQRVAYRTQTQIQILERGHQGPDHPIHFAIPETDYLKTLVVRKIA